MPTRWTSTRVTQGDSRSTLVLPGQWSADRANRRRLSTGGALRLSPLARKRPPARGRRVAHLLRGPRQEGLAARGPVTSSVFLTVGLTVGNAYSSHSV